MTPVPVLSCSPVPVFGCRASTRSLIYFRTTSGQQQLIWKWLRGSADLDASDFGAPTSTTSYALCVYHAPGLLGQLDVAAGSSTWRSIRSGFKYSDPAGIHDGVLKMLLKGGAAGSPKIVVKAKGANIPLPNSVPGGVTTPVTVQLINSDGECWSAFYTQPPLMSGNEVFKGKF